MTHEFWVRLSVALVAIVLSFVAAKLIDRRLARHELAPGTATRYRILRQSILGTIVFVGVASALLVIPAIRGVAVGILASSAVIGLILGFAAQRTIGNFIAGLLIAFTQPVRLGDEIEFESTRGVVEEVGLIYTWVRTPDSDRLVIPNEKLVSETLKNATIRNERPVAEVIGHPAGGRRPEGCGGDSRARRPRGGGQGHRRPGDDRGPPLRPPPAVGRAGAERPAHRDRREAPRSRDLRSRRVRSGMADSRELERFMALHFARKRMRLKRQRRRRRTGS